MQIYLKRLCDMLSHTLNNSDFNRLILQQPEHTEEWQLWGLDFSVRCLTNIDIQQHDPIHHPRWGQTLHKIPLGGELCCKARNSQSLRQLMELHSILSQAFLFILTSNNRVSAISVNHNKSQAYTVKNLTQDLTGYR